MNGQEFQFYIRAEGLLILLSIFTVPIFTNNSDFFKIFLIFLRLFKGFVLQLQLRK